MKKVLIALALACAPVMCLAQDNEPQLENVAPVVAVDSARAYQELQTLIKVARALEDKARYWEDACRSTPECGGK